MPKTRRVPFILTLALLATSGIATAQGSGDSPCSTDKAHQFDFWIGDWEVTAGGQVAGTNDIKVPSRRLRHHGELGRLLGSERDELQLLQPAEGEVAAVLGLAERHDPRDRRPLQRREDDPRGRVPHSGWRHHPQPHHLPRQPDGTVRQHWEVSRDGGKEWQTAFDGLYKKKK